MGSAVRVESDAPPHRSTETARTNVTVVDRMITILVESDDEVRMVRIAGELDLASRAQVTRRCPEGRARQVVVDLSELTFLDCSGYGAFVAARTTLELHRRSLTLVGAVGQPRRLLDLVGHVDRSAR